MITQPVVIQLPHDTVRTLAIFMVLLSLKVLSRTFYRHRIRWVGNPPDDPWADLRLVILLNHTSLLEWLFAGSVPNRFLWRTAKHAVIPAAAKTIERPVIGRFFRFLGQHVIPITRKPDESWQQVLERIDPESMVIILPEGRMLRANGLDADGRPLSVRGGVADVLEAIPEGRMIIAYSGGLHHVQVPGEGFPKLFQSIYLTLENVEVREYRRELAAKLEDPSRERARKEAMKADLERRKARWARPF